MKKTIGMIGFLILTAAMDSPQSAFKENIPIDIKRLSDHAVVLTGSPDPMNCQIAALSSEKGPTIIIPAEHPLLPKKPGDSLNGNFKDRISLM